MEKTEKTRSLLELSIQSYEGTSNAIFNWVVKQRFVCKPVLSQTTVSLNLKKASLKTLFTIIEGNTDYVILYKDDIPVHKTISIQAKTRCVGKDFRIVGVKIPSRR